jgi:hypothetical protein
MECPHCKHKTNETALLQCSHCGEAFERGLLEEYQHLAYLHQWLEERTTLDQRTKERLLTFAEARQNVVRQKLFPPAPSEVKTPVPIIPVLTPAPLKSVVEEKPIPVAEVKPSAVLKAETVEKSVVASAPTPAPIQAKAVPAPAPKPVAPPKPVALPKPVPPPKPKEPPIDWKKVQQQLADFVTSGALLRALLYLGAFMIVISATVLVVRFWNNFPPVLQLLFIAAVPMAFYTGGWALRMRLKLIQAGTVLTGVGAILVAVDFAAIYQFTGLADRVSGPAYWLVATMACTALYIFTAWRLRGEFFDYITLISGASILLVFTRLRQTPLEWSVVSVTLSGAGMAFIAARFHNASGLLRDLARASRYLSQIIIPASLVFVMFSGAKLPVGPMTGFVFAMLGYVFLAWQFPSLVLAYSALGASLGTVFFAMRVVQLPLTWYATVAAVLALAYILLGELLKQSGPVSVMNRHYQQALNGTGFVLIILATLGGFVTLIPELWRGVAAVAIASFDLAVCAYLFRHPGLTFIATGLFIFPFSFAVGRMLYDAQVPQVAAWLTVAWCGLSVAYVSFAAVLRKAEYHALWLYVWAHFLAPVALFVLLLIHRLGLSNSPELASLGLALVVYLMTFILQASHKHPAFTRLEKWVPLGIGKSFFLWPLGVILPVAAAVAWYGSVLLRPWFGAALAGGALAYIGVGQWLFKRAKEYRLPFHLYSYLLCLIGIVIAAPEQLTLLAASLLVVAALGMLAYLYNRVFETVLAGMLFVLPFTLLLRQLNIVLYAHSLGYVMLAALVYVPLAVYLNKFEKSRAAYHHAPLFVVGYGLVIYAVAASVVGRTWDSYLPWVGVAVPLVATAALTYSASYFKTSKLKLPYAWAAALTFAIAFGQSLTLFKVPVAYDTLAWVGLAAVYMFVERLLNRVNQTEDVKRAWLNLFHWPLIAGTLIIAALSLALSAPDTLAALTLGGTKVSNTVPPMLAQLVLVLLAIAAARLYQTRWPLFIEPLLAFVPVTLFFIAFGTRFFGQSLTTPQFAWVWTGLGIVHLLAAVFVDRAKVRYAHGLYLGGYALVSVALLWSIVDRSVLVWSFGLWIVVMLSSALLVHFSRYHTWDELIAFLFGKTKGLMRATARNAFQWLVAWAFPIWSVIFLREINVLDSFAWLGLVVPALAYLLLSLWLKKIDRAYTFALHSAAQFFIATGLIISAPATIRFLAGMHTVADKATLLAFTLLQLVAVIFYICSAWVYQRRWPLLIEPFLAFFPVTLFFIRYSEAIFHQALATPQYALVWTGLGVTHLLAAVFVDRAKVRYAHGLYLGSYVLLSFALLWSVVDRAVLIWSFGVWIVAMLASALLVHFHRHHTWDELVALLFGKTEGLLRVTVHNAFQWLSAWTFPIWCVIFLRALNILESYSWLGLVVPALGYLGLTLWFKRVDATYTYPLHSAAQFFTAIGVLISAPLMFGYVFNVVVVSDQNPLLAFVILQSVAVIFYVFSAWIFKARGFAHVAAWLSILPFTVTWNLYGLVLTSIRLVIPWLLWSTVLLVIGFSLDRNKVRYAQAPYLTGYALALYALVWSVSDRVTNILALSITIVLALLSYVLVHFGRHQAFEDFIHTFWGKSITVSQQVLSTIFMFFAAYAFPVLLTQIFAYYELSLAWRGVSLALAAPIYIALALLLRRAVPKGSLRPVPTWALYSVGYALTAIGVMVAFDDERLATYVLALDAVVFAVSAYIFQQTFWLYLSNVLAPVCVLLILHQTDHLQANWVAWSLTAFAFVYLGIGQLFDRKQKDETSLHPFAVPFYAPSFLMSAIALAVASDNKDLALQVYSIGVVFYALAGILLRETLFIYPAAWLAAVPYYLAVTSSGMEVRWYGLAWLPLIVAYIVLGRVVFHKQPLAPLGQGKLMRWLGHPAIPLYILAYALSLSMIVLSAVTPLTLTLAFGAGALIYFTSAFIFRTPGWLYAGLFAIHMTLLSYFTINPSGGKAYFLAIPFLGLTWLIALAGAAFERYLVKHEIDALPTSLLEHLLGQAWTRPFFIVALADILIWQSAALYGPETRTIVAVGYALLLALFVFLWLNSRLVYGVVGFGLLAFGAWLNQMSVPFVWSVAWFGGVGLGLYLVARLLEALSGWIKPLALWLTPLTNSALALTAAAALLDLILISKNPTATAAAFAFAGALYVTIAYRTRRYALGYFGMALLELAWIIVLYRSDIAQPQFYAIPGGLYFLGIAFLEARRDHKRYAIALELLGLGVLLLPSFIQSLSREDGLPYFILFLVEGFLVLAWGVFQRRKISFFAGIGAVALNLVAQLILLMQISNITRWIVALGAGLLIMGLAIYIERQREQVRARLSEWGETLEQWE